MSDFIGKPFTEYTPDDYALVTAVNLAGFFHITQLAIRQMVDQGNGHILNITTSLVDHASSKSPSALTSLTKGGLAAVTRSLATEHASRGVRVNAVAPGVIKTPEHDPTSYEDMVGLHPVGRIGEISDIVDAILYLEQATFLTGETLHIDGGQAALTLRARTVRPPAGSGGPVQVTDASKMPAIDSFSVASKSSSLCWAERPSVSAREKLAITPRLRARRALASARP